MRALFMRLVQREGTGDDTVHTIVLVTQMLALSRALLPLCTSLIHWLVPHRRKRMKARQVAYGQNCKLRSLAFDTTDGVIDMLQHQPGGYSFFGLLPKRGLRNKFALRKRIAHYLMDRFFTVELLSIMLQASLTPEGRPLTHSCLYDWLLRNVYGGKSQKLYADWLRARSAPLTVIKADRQHTE